MSRPRWTIGRGMVAVLLVGLTLGLLRVSDQRVMDAVTLAAYLMLLGGTSAAIQPSRWWFIKGYAVFGWLSIGAFVAAQSIGARPGRLILLLQPPQRPARPPWGRVVPDPGSYIFGVLDILCGLAGGFLFRGLARASASRVPPKVAGIDPL